MGGEILIVLGIVLLILCAGFFSGAETAMTSVSKVSLRQMAEDGDHRAQIAAGLMEKVESFIGTTLVGTNIAHVTATTLAGLLIQRYAPLEWETWLTSLIMTPLILVFGDMLPKCLGRSLALDFSLMAARPLWLCHKLFLPIVGFTGHFANLLTGLFQSEGSASASHVSRDDLRAMAEMAAEQGLLTAGSGSMFRTIFQLDSRPVTSVMVPLFDVASLPLTATVADVETLGITTGFSRFPVYQERPDELVGVVDLRELIYGQHEPVLREDTSIQEFVEHNVIFVPETQSVASLMDLLRYQEVSMAVVVDEHGIVVGIVTLEDILEEIVGDIQAGGRTSPLLRQLETGLYECKGKLEVRKLNELLGLNIELDGFDTVAGLVLRLAGRIPDVGEVFHHQDFDLRIVKATRKRVKTVHLILQREE
jgi:CBS domain containing-hemolysin-like protein